MALHGVSWVRGGLSKAEVKEILFHVREELLPELDREISVWRDNHSSDEDPEDYFSHFKMALSDYAKAFDDNPVALAWIEEGIGKIDKAIEGLQSETPDAWEPDDYYHGESGVVHAPDARSIFDDVDE